MSVMYVIESTLLEKRRILFLMRNMYLYEIAL